MRSESQRKNVWVVVIRLLENDQLSQAGCWKYNGNCILKSCFPRKHKITLPSRESSKVWTCFLYNLPSSKAFAAPDTLLRSQLWKDQTQEAAKMDFADFSIYVQFCKMWYNSTCFKGIVETHINSEKIRVPIGVWTHDLPNTGRMLYQMSYKDSEGS